MNPLLLEIGNSTLKLAHADGDSLAIERFDLSAIDALAERCVQLAGSLICARTGAMSLNDPVARLRERGIDVRVIEREELRGFVGESYDTPATLGIDRVFNVMGMAADGVVISCGTAITIDARSRGRPVWGGILPGFRTAAEGLHLRIPALPAVPLDAAVGMPARDTMGSVGNGILLGTAHAVRGIAGELAGWAFGGDAPRIVVTGGDADTLLRLWPGASAPEIDQALLFRGMLRFVRG